MESQKYEVVIGLEVHAQLSTKSKLFCRCPVEFGDEPNTDVCPVCLGLPGVLPTLNRKAVELAIKAGLALGCKISLRSRFARKHYFYPDLPKGYQITQYTEPLAYDGVLDIGGKKIRIRRVHLEEDAGKLIHSDIETLIDFNRCGVPLIEIVTEPDMNSAEEAYRFLTTLRQILRYLGVSSCDMEKGEFRCEPNISLHLSGKGLGVRREIKNLNSLKAVKEALEYEIRYQRETLKKGGKIIQETLLWNPAEKRCEPMRGKEESEDYRYFPEPDLPPLVIRKEEIEEIKRSLPELPHQKRERFLKEYKLPNNLISVLVEEKGLADYYEEVVREIREPKLVANWIVTEMKRVMREKGMGLKGFPISPKSLAELLGFVKGNRISRIKAKEVFYKMADTGKGAKEIIEEKGWELQRDKGEVLKIAEEVIKRHPEIVEKYRKGKTTVIGFLIGEGMRLSKGKFDPKELKKAIESLILEF